MARSNTPERRLKIQELVAQIGKLSGEREVQLYRYNSKAKEYEVANLQTAPEDLHQMMYATDVDNYNGGYTYFAVSPIANRMRWITIFGISPFPGCCALCISNNTQVRTEYQNRGINRVGLRLREAIANFMGYTAILCTDIARNESSIKTIEGGGFTKFHSLKNRRTNNLVNLYIKDLGE